MKPTKSKGGKTTPRRASAKSMSTPGSKRASLFRNGANQAVRLPQELRFPDEMKEVRIRKQGDGLLISPVRPSWASFFSREIDVPDDFLEKRDDSPPQVSEPL